MPSISPQRIPVRVPVRNQPYRLRGYTSACRRMCASAASTCARLGASTRLSSRASRIASPASRVISRAGLPIRRWSRSASRSRVETATICDARYSGVR
jgi:hypothetical protein